MKTATGPLNASVWECEWRGEYLGIPGSARQWMDFQAGKGVAIQQPFANKQTWRSPAKTWDPWLISISSRRRSSAVSWSEPEGCGPCRRSQPVARTASRKGESWNESGPIPGRVATSTALSLTCSRLKTSGDSGDLPSERATKNIQGKGTALHPSTAPPTKKSGQDSMPRRYSVASWSPSCKASVVSCVPSWTGPSPVRKAAASATRWSSIAIGGV